MCYLVVVVLCIIVGWGYWIYCCRDNKDKKFQREFTEYLKEIEVEKEVVKEQQAKEKEDKIISDQAKKVEEYIEEVRKLKNIEEAKITKAVNNTCPKCKCKKTIHKIQWNKTIVVCTKCKNEWLLSTQIYWHTHHVVLDVLGSVNKWCKDIFLTYIEYRNWLVENGIYKETMLKMDHWRVNYNVPIWGIYIFKQDINNIDYLKSIKD